MRKGSKHSAETKILMKESNKDSIKKALRIKLENYKNIHPCRKTNPYLYLKSRNLKRDFGITLSEYDILFKEQGGRCAICGTQQNNTKNSKSLSIDHDHNTDRVRGLLCDCCNRGLGLFKDNILLLEKAKNYLLR